MTGKTSRGLMSLDFSCNIQTVALEIGLNKMKARACLTLYQNFRAVVLV